MTARALQDIQPDFTNDGFDNIGKLPDEAQENFERLAEIDSEDEGKAMALDREINRTREDIGANRTAAGMHDRNTRQGERDNETTAKRRVRLDIDHDRFVKRLKKLTTDRSALRIVHYANTALRWAAKMRGAWRYQPAPTTAKGDGREHVESLISTAMERHAMLKDLDAANRLPEDVAIAHGLKLLGKRAKRMSIAPCFRMRPDGFTDKPVQGGLGLPMKYASDAMGGGIEVVDVEGLFFWLHHDAIAEKLIAEAKQIAKSGKPVLSVEARAARKAELNAEIQQLLFQASAWAWRARRDGYNVRPPIITEIDRKILVPCWLQIVPVTADEAADDALEPDADGDDFDFG